MAANLDDWTAWLNEHGPALLLLARQWTASRTDAEDVVQEAFVRFWRSRERAMDPAAYLYACVKRTSLDWQRSRQRRQRREQATARTEAEPQFAVCAEQDERRQAVEAAIRHLPHEQREVVVMRIWGGLTSPQIAAVLQVSENTAASRYRYALARLREQLAEEPIR